MTDVSALDDFLGLVLKNLEKNGFPGKSVSFPLEKMYETASQRGFSFNKVRDALKERNIASEISGDRVVFRQEADESDMFDMAKMAEAAQKMFESMPPEQREKISQMIQNMDSDEIAKIKDQWDQMPADEKARVISAANKNLDI